METVGFILGRLFEPPLRLLFYVYNKGLRHSSLRMGTLTFWGPQIFLESCAASVERLRKLDPDLFYRITTKQRLDFYYDPKHQTQVNYAWIFSLDDLCLSWKTDGIIARVVCAFYLAELLPRRAIPKATRRTLNSHAFATTSAWLERHGFPEPLVSVYKKC